MPAIHFSYQLHSTNINALVWTFHQLDLNSGMSLNLIAYLSLLTISFLVSLTVRRKAKYVPLFITLLGSAIVTEIMVQIVYRQDRSSEAYNVVYHLYVLVEYALTMLIFRHFIRSEQLRRILQWSIPLYWIISLYFSFQSTFYAHPAANLNLTGIVVIILSIYTLFKIRPEENHSIFKHALFWFCIGWVFYHAGTFIFNFLYDYLRNIGKNEIAEQLQQYIIRSFNYFLYSAFTIGFLCLRQIRK